MTIDDIMRQAPVIPVIVWDCDLDPVAVAATLVENGLPVIEVTLRTEAALEAMRAMATVEGAIVGAGTVSDPEMLKASVDAGAQFIVSPGLTERIARSAAEAQVPFLPGIATASDLLRGMELGLDRFKFFPAEAAGGIPAIKALSAPFPKARFCPTGGITEETARNYLAAGSVLCVGGSWVVPRRETDLAAIAHRAKAASALREAARV